MSTRIIYTHTHTQKVDGSMGNQLFAYFMLSLFQQKVINLTTRTCTHAIMYVLIIFVVIRYMYVQYIL